LSGGWPAAVCGLLFVVSPSSFVRRPSSPAVGKPLCQRSCRLL
jgi:hypothetical protein